MAGYRHMSDSGRFGGGGGRFGGRGDGFQGRDRDRGRDRSPGPSRDRLLGSLTNLNESQSKLALSILNAVMNSNDDEVAARQRMFDNEPPAKLRRVEMSGGYDSGTRTSLLQMPRPGSGLPLPPHPSHHPWAEEPPVMMGQGRPPLIPQGPPISRGPPIPRGPPMHGLPMPSAMDMVHGPQQSLLGEGPNQIDLREQLRSSRRQRESSGAHVIMSSAAFVNREYVARALGQELTRGPTRPDILYLRKAFICVDNQKFIPITLFKATQMNIRRSMIKGYHVMLKASMSDTPLETYEYGAAVLKLTEGHSWTPSSDGMTWTCVLYKGKKQGKDSKEGSGKDSKEGSGKDSKEGSTKVKSTQSDVGPGKQREESPKPDEKLEKFRCFVCEKTYTLPHIFRQHRISNNHHKILTSLYIEKRMGAMSTNKLFEELELCRLRSALKEEMKDNAAITRERLSNLRMCRGNFNRCYDCKVKCESQEELSDHCISLRHLTKESAIVKNIHKMLTDSYLDTEVLYSEDVFKKKRAIIEKLSIVGRNKREIPGLKIYDPSDFINVDHLVKVADFVCQLCPDTVLPNAQAALAHYKTEQHYNNYQAHLCGDLKLVAETCPDKAAEDKVDNDVDKKDKDEKEKEAREKEEEEEETREKGEEEEETRKEEEEETKGEEEEETKEEEEGGGGSDEDDEGRALRDDEDDLLDFEDMPNADSGDEDYVDDTPPPPKLTPRRSSESESNSGKPEEEIEDEHVEADSEPSPKKPEQTTRIVSKSLSGLSARSEAKGTKVKTESTPPKKVIEKTALLAEKTKAKMSSPQSDKLKNESPVATKTQTKVPNVGKIKANLTSSKAKGPVSEDKSPSPKPNTGVKAKTTPGKTKESHQNLPQTKSQITLKSTKPVPTKESVTSVSAKAKTESPELTKESVQSPSQAKGKGSLAATKAKTVSATPNGKTSSTNKAEPATQPVQEKKSSSTTAKPKDQIKATTNITAKPKAQSPVEKSTESNQDKTGTKITAKPKDHSPVKKLTESNQETDNKPVDSAKRKAATDPSEAPPFKVQTAKRGRIRGGKVALSKK